MSKRPIAAALEAAVEAGALLMMYRDRPLEIAEKAGRRADIVTAADRASEALVVALLRRHFPHAAVLGEEGGVSAGTSGERWIVDPLDGTTNYAHGYPFFCVSIAYEIDGVVTAGVVYAPMLDECFAAERGRGATCNDRPIAVSRVERLADAMVCTGFKPFDYDRNGRYFASASHHAQAVRRDGSAALDLAYTAAGRFDAFWEFDLHPWDTAAGTLIVAEAGGRIATADDGAWDLGADSVLASNGRPLHAELSALLRVRE